MLLYLRRAVRGVNTNCGAVVAVAAVAGVVAVAGDAPIAHGHAIVGSRYPGNVHKLAANSKLFV